MLTDFGKKMLVLYIKVPTKLYKPMNCHKNDYLRKLRRFTLIGQQMAETEMA